MTNQPELQALVKIESRMARLEAIQESNTRAISEMATSVNRLIEKLDKSDDVAKEALQRVKSAQHQINDVRSDLSWAWRTALGALVTGVIGVILKFWGG
jgi:DNA repair ATPase RecN